MTLKDYLKTNRITFRAFSQRVNIDAAQLNRYANKVQMPSMESAHKIYVATKKKVTFLSWFE